jgi:CHAT domain-containing protein
MEETRAQAYLQLIETLLNCPNDEEPQILQANLELLDSGFLQVCEVVAENLAEEGQENPANFLRNLVSQLGQFLGMNNEGDSDNSEGENPQEYANFIGQLLQAEADSKGDIKVIYPMLVGRQHLLNDRFVETLQQVTPYLIAEHPEAIEFILGLIGNLSIDISDFPLGQRANNLEIAITGYQIVLNNWEPGSENWAMTQNNLAAAYTYRIRGEKAENIELAIASCTAALTVYTRDAFPEDWAMTQNNLAAAYTKRIRGEKVENIELAIASGAAALSVRTRDDFPENWARTQHNLASAYTYRIRGEKAENIELAIASFTAALTVLTRDAFPEYWAMTQNNLGLACTYRIRGEKAENIENAIAFYTAALSVYTREAFPEDWAMTQNNLGEAYRNRIRGEKAENIESAIASFTAALTVYTRDAFPEYWAATQNNLAIAYTYRIRGEKAENIENAIESFTAALTVYTRDAFPEYWAMTQHNLGVAYSNRIRGEKPENIELAKKCYHNALTIRTREAFPQKYTETLSNLGNFYRSNQQWQVAYDTYARAIETVEFLRGEIQSGDETKQKLAEEWNKLYLGMIEVCIKLKHYTEAVEYAERSKGQNLIELLSVKDLYPKGEIPPQVRQELQQLRLRIAEENRRLKQAEEKNYDFINQLRQDLAAKYPYTPLKFGEIQKLADEKTAIVEWYILGESFCAFLIANDPPQPPLIRGEQEGSESPLKMGENQLEVTQLSHSEPDRNSEPPLLRGAGGIGFWQSSPQDLEKLIDWVNEYLGNYYSNRQEWQNSLETKLANLAQILHINEIVKNIPETCDKLILIPHRYLHLFPLHAIPVSRENWQRFHPNNQNCPLNPCLVDCFDNGVSYAPSCQLLHQVQKYKRGKFDQFFAIQNPTDDLTAAEMEVQSIKNIFPSPEIFAKQDPKKGKQSESKLEIAEKVADSHHLFFSCHGFFDPNAPLKSGLQLADGTLTLEEIIRYFNLTQCSLVTLSACETGQVQLDNTDEYISLTSGFLLAGSPSLYVSLWSVHPLSTAILLIRTYENLYHQPGKFALALSQAQIWMRDTDIQGFLDWTNQCHLLDTDWRGTLQCLLEKDKATQGLCAKIYQNPFHWAGFCAAGKAEQNMTNSSNKIEIFQQLIQSDFYFNLRYALVSLKNELTDNDDKNVELIENWLQDKPAIKFEYKANVMKSEEVKLPNKGQSPTKPGQQSQILKETLENLTITAEKPPEANQDTPSSP